MQSSTHTDGNEYVTDYESLKSILKKRHIITIFLLICPQNNHHIGQFCG